MKKLLLFILLPLFFQNCFDKEVTVYLKKDGSGTITERVKIELPPELKQEKTKKNSPGQGEETPAVPNADEASQEDIATAKKKLQIEKMEEAATKMGEGVRYLSLKELSENNSSITEVVFTFRDINLVKLNSGMQMNMNQEEEPAKPEIGFNYDSKAGILKINFEPRKKEKTEEDKVAAPEEKPKNPQMEMMMKKIFKSLRLAFVLEFESKIEKTDSSFPDLKRNTVTLYDVSFAKVLEMGEKDKKLLNEIGENNTEALQKITGIRFENKKLVTVQFKK